MADDYDDQDLHLLRQQALSSTQKRKNAGRSSQEHYRSAQKDRKPSPIRPEEIIDSYTRPKSEKRNHPSKGQKSAPKRSRRDTSSSRSSYTSYSHSGSRSPSRSHSFSTSRSSSGSRSRSRASSRSSSYSGSESGSYSRSSVSGSMTSDRSRSPSPVSRKVSKKSRVASSSYQDKARQSYHGREVTDRHASRKVYAEAPHKSSSGRQERRNRPQSHMPRGQDSSVYMVERPQPGERRSHHGPAGPVSDNYYHGTDSRRKSPHASKHSRSSNFPKESEVYSKSSRDRPSRAPRGASPNASFHRPTVRSPRHREREQQSLMRERRVVRNSPPPPPASSSRNDRRYQSPNRQQQRWPNHSTHSPQRAKNHRKATGNYSPERGPNRSHDVQVRMTPRNNRPDRRNKEEMRSGGSRHVEERGRHGERGVNRHVEPAPRYVEREGRYAEREGRYAEKEGRYVEKEGRYAEREGRYAEREGRYAEREGRYAEREGRYAEREGRYAEREGRVTEREARLPEREGRHADRGNRHLESESRHIDSGGRRAEGGNRHVEGGGRRAEGGNRHVEGSGRHLEGGSRHDRERSRREDKEPRAIRKERRSNGVSSQQPLSRHHPDASSPEFSDDERRDSRKRKSVPPLSDEEQLEVERESRRERKRKRQEEAIPQSSSELAVLDSVSPQKEMPKEEDEEPEAEVKEKAPKTAEKDKQTVESEQDLLGEYDFNPFVDVELDYDETMEETNVVEESQPQEDQSKIEEVVEEELEQGIVEDEESGSEHDSQEISHEDISSDSSPEADNKKGTTAISSPIRVTPDRDMERKNGSGSKWRGEKKRPSSGGSKKLSVKERLFVSRKTIEEKKSALGRKSIDTLRPSLANRLGPSPSLRQRHSSSGGNKRYSAGDKGGAGGGGGYSNRPSKGSALEIAQAYKKKRIKESKISLHDDERHKTKKMSKLMGSSQDYVKSSKKRKLSPLPVSLCTLPRVQWDLVICLLIVSVFVSVCGVGRKGFSDISLWYTMQCEATCVWLSAVSGVMVCGAGSSSGTSHAAQGGIM